MLEVFESAMPMARVIFGMVVLVLIVVAIVSVPSLCFIGRWTFEKATPSSAVLFFEMV